MKFIDLFAGVGGFRYGLEKSSGSFECVYSNEYDKYANSVYRRHYGECDQTDIREVPAADIPDHDLLCAGFPCQAFSIAGKRGGFEDTRGTLFFEIARILQHKQPSYLLLENVKGLLSHQNGRTFQTILAALDELGYDCQWQVLNSKDFGVPQNRERVFIVGHTRGEPRPQVFPIRVPDTEYPQAVGAKRQPLRYLQRNQKNIEGDYFYALDGSHTNGLRIGSRIRKLTPLECERLQAFPDNWTKYGHDGQEISDTQRYKQMGNAVTTSVVTEIGKRLYEKRT